MLLTLADVHQVGSILIVLRQYVNRHAATAVTVRDLIHAPAPQIGADQTAESQCVNRLVKTELAASLQIHVSAHQVGAVMIVLCLYVIKGFSYPMTSCQTRSILTIFQIIGSNIAPVTIPNGATKLMVLTVRRENTRSPQ
jgi:hypothetical protein